MRKRYKGSFFNEVLFATMIVIIVAFLVCLGYNLKSVITDKNNIKYTSNLRKKIEREVNEESGVNEENDVYNTHKKSDNDKNVSRNLVKGLIERYQNEDIIGYLVLEGYDIEYPILQSTNNEYYLKKNPYGLSDFSGSIFLDCDNRGDFSDKRSILYGHNMSNGSMFGRLSDIYGKEIQGKSFKIYTNDSILIYDVFCSGFINENGENYLLFPGKRYLKELLELGLSEDEVNEMLSYDNYFDDFLKELKSDSILWDSKVSNRKTKKVVTLVTCTGYDRNKRFIVSGMLRNEEL